jgi:ferredoxin
MDAIAEATNVDDPRQDATNYGIFVVDEDECTRCALCIDRCPTSVISLGKYEGSLAEQAENLAVSAPWESTPASATTSTGMRTACGSDR